MSITAGLVLFAMIWFMVFFVVLPLRVKTQGEQGDVVPGTPPSAPAQGSIGAKAKLTTAIAAVLWALIATAIVRNWVTLADIDWFGQLAR